MFRVLVFLVSAVCVLRAREFDPRCDAFAFANETVLAYDVDKTGKLRVTARATPAHLTHRCFCFTRTVMQFWNFARFEPHAPRLTEEAYRSRVRSLFRIPVWSKRTERIVLPGFKNLWDFSLVHDKLVQAEFGSWVITYLRPGNMRMISPFVRFRQRAIAEEIFADVSRGNLRALYLAKFPHMNHAVVVYSAQRLTDGRIRFRVYDSNYAGESARLDYVPAHNLFDFERRFYWPGGELRAFPVYNSLFR